ncbi:hypothetical protein EBT11_05615 [bacterium]|nr:hypothetical protein [bacterium]
MPVTSTTGGSATFSVTAVNPAGLTQGLTYQWTKDGIPIPGANGSALVLSSLAVSSSGAYRATISNLYGAVDSGSAVLTVNKAIPVLSWTPNPAANLTYPTPLSYVQLNATSSVAGNFTYSPTNGSILNGGTNLLVATFTPADTNNYVSGGTITNTVVPLDDSLTVTGGDTFSGATIQIEAGFAPGDTLALTSGIGSITGVYDGTKGILTLSGSGSASAYQSALRAVTFSTTSTSTAERGFKVTLGSAISFGGHYYEYVSGSYTWAQARALALSKTFNGLSGYLANLTSAAENSFVLTKIGADVWIGGSDSVTDGVWKWMDGPEAGITFWNGLSGGSAPSGRFANWNPGEPNNYGGSEDYAQFYVGTGKWNDLPTSSRLGFLVEYGTDAPATQTFSGARTFSVTKATPTITTAPTAAPISYGQTLGSSALSGGVANVPGTFAWATPSAALPVGSSSQSVTFTPNDTANYTPVTTMVIATVNKATPTITGLPEFMSATGGTMSTTGGYAIHTFTNVGVSTFRPTGSGTVEILVVGGGGGAGFDGGGGGGAGGVITNTVSVVAGTSYPVVVGVGGAAAIAQSGPNGSPGGNSQFGSITAIGGAGGYNGHAGSTATTTGGSGGGEGFNGGGPGNGTPGQGNRGGYKYADSAGGGGGGAGELGGSASNGRGGNGGKGIQSDISGVATWYGGGGAGGSWNGFGGIGGLGGGGNGGGNAAPSGSDGVANTGGGGGGNGYASSNNSGKGGSGIVIVRYQPKIITYGQSIGEATLSGATASVPGSFAFANPSATPAVGSSSQSVIFTPSDTANYETVTTSVVVFVAKATPTILTPPTSTSIGYGQTLGSSALSGGVANEPGTFAWTTPSVLLPVGSR